MIDIVFALSHFAQRFDLGIYIYIKIEQKHKK